LAPCQNKFAILFHFIYLVYYAKRSAGELLTSSSSFCIVNKIYKVNQNVKLVRFCDALKCCSSAKESTRNEQPAKTKPIFHRYYSLSIRENTKQHCHATTSQGLSQPVHKQRLSFAHPGIGAEARLKRTTGSGYSLSLVRRQ